MSFNLEAKFHLVTWRANSWLYECAHDPHATGWYANNGNSKWWNSNYSSIFFIIAD
jgi:hypothetical protein